MVTVVLPNVRSPCRGKDVGIERTAVSIGTIRAELRPADLKREPADAFLSVQERERSARR
jgi:hypothetical protein